MNELRHMHKSLGFFDEEISHLGVDVVRIGGHWCQEDDDDL